MAALFGRAPVRPARQRGARSDAPFLRSANRTRPTEPSPGRPDVTWALRRLATVDQADVALRQVAIRFILE